jgi:fructose-1,6-bisphosphatase/inositol monophosphatase family enzyme
MEEIPLREFESLIGDVIPQMKRIRRDVLTGPTTIGVKPEDGSLVTDTDREVELELRASAARFGIAYFGEEFGFVAATRNGRYVLIVDPVDGTRPRSNLDLGGSTVIAYVYDKIDARIVFSIIGRPGTGELLLAMDGVTRLFVCDYKTDTVEFVRECAVWLYDEKITRPTVYVDNPNAFTRRGEQMLTEDGLDLLDSRLRKLSLTKFTIGSNGLHHMLVALGGVVAGAITTSIGGIQDLGGILVVENAGGCVRAFRLSDTRTLIEVSPHSYLLMEGGYDFVVFAIDYNRCTILVEELRAAVACN